MPLSSASIVDFEQVNVSCEINNGHSRKMLCSNHIDNIANQLTSFYMTKT